MRVRHHAALAVDVSAEATHEVGPGIAAQGRVDRVERPGIPLADGQRSDLVTFYNDARDRILDHPDPGLRRLAPAHPLTGSKDNRATTA